MKLKILYMLFGYIKSAKLVYRTSNTTYPARNHSGSSSRRVVPPRNFGPLSGVGAASRLGQLRPASPAAICMLGR